MGASVGAGVILGALALVMIWKRTMRKTAAILALLSGLCLSATVVQYAGVITGLSAGGVGIVTGILVIGGLIFVHEIRGHGHHHKRTPAIGFAVGVAVMLAGGAIGQLGQHAQTSVVNTVHSGTNATVGGG